MSRREEILGKLAGIESLPASTAQVLRLVQDPQSSMNDIMKCIEVDPGLTTRVLRMANSAYFAGPRKIGSLREAGVLFGTNRIQQMVVATTVAPLAAGAIRGYDLEPGRLLDSLIAVAIGAEEIPHVIKLPAAPAAFTAGLLHGVGKIVLGTFVEIDAAPILQFAYEDRIPFDEAERRVLGIDHAEAGALLLERWQFPEELVQAVRWQHHPENAHTDTLLTDLVHVAGILCIQCGLGMGIDGLNYSISSEVVDRLHLNTNLAESVACKMLTELENIRNTLLGTGKRG